MLHSRYCRYDENDKGHDIAAPIGLFERRVRKEKNP